MSIGAINGVSGVGKIYNEQSNAMKGTSSVGGDAFKSIFEAAKNNVTETAKLQQESDQMTNDFVTGKTDNIHQVMIAAEKANLALQFTVELRNKAIEAYKELMRMQV